MLSVPLLFVQPDLGRGWRVACLLAARLDGISYAVAVDDAQLIYDISRLVQQVGHADMTLVARPSRCSTALRRKRSAGSYSKPRAPSAGGKTHGSDAFD